MFRNENDGYPITTLIACDNAIARAGLSQILSTSGFRLVDTLEAMPTLCVVDGSRLSEEIFETVRVIKSQLPLTKVALLKSSFDLDFAQAAFSAGVDGLCSMTGEQSILIKSLELIALGEKLVPSAVAQLLLSQATRVPEQSPITATAVQSVSDPLAQKLSPREREILRAIMAGDANKVIARKLDVAEATIKVHVKAILRKVGASNRTQAAMWASTNLTGSVRPTESTKVSH